MHKVWNGMKTITSCSRKGGGVVGGDLERADELNTFFNGISSSPATCPPATWSAPQSSPRPPNHHHSTSSHLSLSPPPSASASDPPPPSITTDQVRIVLGRLHCRKAADPDRVCPRLLMACAAELCEPLQWVYNLRNKLHLNIAKTKVLDCSCYVVVKLALRSYG